MKIVICNLIFVISICFAHSGLQLVEKALLPGQDRSKIVQSVRYRPIICDDQSDVVTNQMKWYDETFEGKRSDFG